MKRLVIIMGLMFLGLVTAIPQQKLDDADIADAIENECRFDHAIDVNKIDVDVNYGIATLTGTVDSYLEKKEAEWVTSGIEGVNEVNNQLTVHYPYSYFWWGYYPYYNLYITPP